MLNALELTNFKAFGTKVRIPLAPITLIFGENSAGKSSILQALNSLKQTLESTNKDSPLLTTLDSGTTDLGSFQSCLHAHDISKSISFGLEVISTRSDKERGGKLEFSISQEEGENPQLTKVSVYKLANADPSLEMKSVHEDSHRAGLGLAIDISKLVEKISDSTFQNYFNNKEELFIRPLKDSLKRVEERPDDDEYKAELLDAMAFHSDDVTRESLCKRIVEVVKYPTVPFRNFVPRLQLLKKSGLRLKDATEEEKFIQTHLIDQKFFDDEVSATDIYEAIRDVENFFNHEYIPIGPIRHAPKRVYVSDGLIPKGVGYNGESVCEYLAHHKEQLTLVNQWLKRLKCAYSIDVVRNEGRLGSTQIYELLLSDEIQQNNVQVSLPDVGYGISQFLPIVVQAVASKRKTISIEQPELHLHPGLQTEIADLFIEGYKERANHFIVETHSEHLILRLLKRIRQTTDGTLPEGVAGITPDDVSVLYVQRGENGSEVNQLGIDAEGYFVDDWPNGFFSERLDELI